MGAEDVISPEAGPVAREPLPTDVALAELTHRQLLLFGHGTQFEEQAAGIVAHGLGLDVSLADTSIPMATHQTDPAALNDNRKLLENWPHSRFGIPTKFVVMIGVERREDMPNSRYAYAIMQPVPPDRPYVPNAPRKSYIDARYVAGYFNMTEGLFVPNLAFNPRFYPALLQTTTDLYLNMRRLPALAFMGDEDQRPSSTPQNPNDQTRTISPDADVW